MDVARWTRRLLDQGSELLQRLFTPRCWVCWLVLGAWHSVLQNKDKYLNSAHGSAFYTRGKERVLGTTPGLFARDFSPVPEDRKA